jgi:hypothetical protein
MACFYSGYVSSIEGSDLAVCALRCLQEARTLSGVEILTLPIGFVEGSHTPLLSGLSSALDSFGTVYVRTVPNYHGWSKAASEVYPTLMRSFGIR